MHHRSTFYTQRTYHLLHLGGASGTNPSKSQQQDCTWRKGYLLAWLAELDVPGADAGPCTTSGASSAVLVSLSIHADIFAPLLATISTL